MKFKRVYHRYQDWEEIKHNMWGAVADRAKYFDWALMFTGDHKLYGHYMMRVISEWPISCENSLTDYSINRKAWIGHAACALANQCPEDIVRSAWSHLTNEQRFLANAEAERAISAWEVSYIKSKQLYKNMGVEMLFGWDT